MSTVAAVPISTVDIVARLKKQIADFWATRQVAEETTVAYVLTDAERQTVVTMYETLFTEQVKAGKVPDGQLTPRDPAVNA